MNQKTSPAQNGILSFIQIPPPPPPASASTLQKQTHMFSFNTKLQMAGRSLIQFPTLHGSGGRYTVQPVNSNKRSFLISEDEQVCRRTLDFNQPPFVVWSVVLCVDRAVLEPNLHDCLTGLPAKLPQSYMELFVARSLHPVAITGISHLGSRSFSPSGAALACQQRTDRRTVLTRMKSCAHIIKRPENMPRILHSCWKKGLILLQQGLKGGFYGFISVSFLEPRRNKNSFCL